jgi:hypothetical protein
MPNPATLACPYCRQSLTDLQQRSPAAHCGAAPCRQAHALASQARGRTAALQQRRQEAPTHWRPRVAGAPVIWLRHFRPQMAALDDGTRERFVAHLRSVATAPELHGRDPVFDHPETIHLQAHAADAPLCTACGGRCCQLGLAHHAFIDAPVLQRWAARAPGRTLADAAEHYAAQLPARHVGGSCAYHGDRGCVLPREDRAPICNAHACDSLQATRRALDDEGGAFIAEPLADDVPRAGWLPAGATALELWGPDAPPAGPAD